MSRSTIAEPVGSIGSFPRFTAVHGRAKVLALHGALASLAERCGQSGVMDYLPFFLSTWKLGVKTPHLLLLPDIKGELQAGVLLYEYGIGRLSSGIFVPADHCGERTVLAPEPLRSLIAWQAAAFLMDRGAHLVFLTLANGDFASGESAVSRKFRLCSLTCGTRQRLVLRTLRIASTFDETIAGMGPDTRRNLRRYRRRAESQLRAAFVPEADLSQSEFLALNRRSLYPVPPRIVRWRFRNARSSPDSLLVGLQGSDGSWLSLMGGRRRGQTTYLDWQMNLKDFSAYSIGTALRAYLIENEVARGTQRLTFEDGTTHAMNRGFIPEDVSDLLLARRSLSPDILRKVAAYVPMKRNVLASTILQESLIWRFPPG